MSGNINLIKSFLNYCSDKGKVINQNIANINTENYQRRDIYFGSYLEDQLNSMNKNTASNSSLEESFVVEDKGVTIEEEMAEMAKNTINFKFAAKRASGYYKNLQSVIKSGG